MNRSPTSRALTSVRRFGVTISVAALAALVVACGDDDDESASTPVTSVAPTRAAATASAPTTPADQSDAAGFCQAELAAERAVSTEDPAVIQPAFEAAAAAAPTDIKAAVDTVIESFQAGEQDSPEFGAAYGEIIDYVKGSCGFGEVTVTASEYAFAGLPDTVEAGPVVVTFENTGTEFHELLIMRVNDGVTETLDALLALPEEEGQTKMASIGGTFAAPDETSHRVIDLQPGRYIAICFLPTGATPENMPQIQSGEHEGAPHFTQGMAQEITAS